MKMKKFLLASLLAASVIPADAANLVMPTSLATTNANTNSNTFFVNASRTSQSQIAASELGGLHLGDMITGVSFRLESGTFTGSDTVFFATTFAQYQITLAQAANTMANFGTNVTANMVSPVLVRTGSLTLPADYFPYTAPATTPNAFSPPISFTNPYAYAGGDMILLVSHAGGGDTNTYFDSANTLDPSYGTLFRTSRADAYQSPTLTILNSSFIVAQFQYTRAAPEPATCGLLGLGTLLLAARRRRSAQVSPHYAHRQSVPGMGP